MEGLKEGTSVSFFPSNKTAKKFKNKKKTSYPAIITDVNEATVCLTVLGVSETIFAENVPHLDHAGNGRSYWTLPA